MSAASTRKKRPLTQSDKVLAFRGATGVLVRKYGERFAAGMTDAELEAALKDSLGIFAGRCGPGQLHLTWQGAGLKIWASWHIHNHVWEAPIFAGKVTIAMAARSTKSRIPVIRSCRFSENRLPFPSRRRILLLPTPP